MSNETNKTDNNSTSSLDQMLADLTKPVETKKVPDTTEMLSDPDIMKILEAKQNGKKVKVVADDAVATPPPASADAKPGSMDQFTRVVAAYDAKIADLEKTVNQLKGHAVSTEAERAKKEVDRAKAKYGDFETMRPVMIEINKVVPGLDIDELYLIAKKRTATKVGPEVESERPDTTTTRPSVIDMSKKDTYRGVGGFRAAISAALDQAIKPS
jgi:hypothetical protein